MIFTGVNSLQHLVQVMTIYHGDNAFSKGML